MEMLKKSVTHIVHQKANNMGGIDSYIFVVNQRLLYTSIITLLLGNCLVDTRIII